MDAQFENLCRICAANTKSKNNSVVECVFIFKTLGLKDKIERHLFLNVDENDLLPKVLCKSCYRQVEATASLSNIAKHTQRVFRDFLLSTVPKNARETTSALLDKPSTSAQSCSSSSASNQQQQKSSHFEPRREDVDEFRPIVLPKAPETSITLAPPGSHSLHSSAGSQINRDEVIISLTKKDKSPQQPQQHQQNRSNSQFNVGGANLIVPRRNSVFPDSNRYGYAPMSIAQRSMQVPPTLVPLNSEVTLSKTTIKTSGSPEKKHSPAGVINFIQTHGRITGNAPHQATIKPTKTEDKATDRSGPSTSTTISSTGVPHLPSNVLQQKRRNLKNALNNIKAINSGQVSLLKSSQTQRSHEELRPLVTTTVVPHKTLLGSEQSVEEVLPEHIIIAAPKKKKDVVESQPSLLRSEAPKASLQIPTSSGGGGGTMPPLVALPVTQAAPSAPPVAPKEQNPQKMQPTMSSLTEAISLGNVIRDPDLLKLILKALKWPVTSGNCDEQMTRLKNSKFAVIMSDSNLLQDTDLTQLLGPYLAPMLAVAKQKQASTSPPAVSPPQSSNLTDLASAMPYKLPPETSVQLVPSSPTETEAPQQLPKTLISSMAKRSQRKPRPQEQPDDQAKPTASTSNAAHVTNELLNINAMLISQFGNNPADALNEALKSMLKKQQESKNRRQTRRRRSASTASSSINLEDIVLVEPQPSLEPQPNPQLPPVESLVTDMVNFKLPSQLTAEQQPLITRPIIKRRKTIQQAAKKRESPSAKPQEEAKPVEESQPKTPVPVIEINENEDEEEPSPPEDIKEDTPESKSASAEAPQAPTSTVASDENAAASQEELENAASVSAVGSTKSSASGARKPPGTKSALGQKLLEAIGLQEVTKDAPRDSLRSALKRSLKQAQEQQQQLKRVKLEEPVKQLADSTTKPSASESEEHKKAIAERELALLKRKAKELEKSEDKDEKPERPDVSSSSSRNRRNRKGKANEAKDEEYFSATEEKRSERWDEDDDLPLKTEPELKPSGRPTRTSKTNSKYYKERNESEPPSKTLSPASQKSHGMGTRSTRQR